jgi:hypothetical protein
LIELKLQALPDVGRLGGNARPGHHMQTSAWRRAESDMWIGLLTEQGFGRSESPKIMGPALLKVILYYPTRTMPDVDNIIASLKPLIDCLEPFRVIKKGINPLGWTTRGHAGLIEDDNLLEWGQLRRSVDKTLAPLTVLQLHYAESTVTGLYRDPTDNRGGPRHGHPTAE